MTRDIQWQHTVAWLGGGPHQPRHHPGDPGVRASEATMVPLRGTATASHRPCGDQLRVKASEPSYAAESMGQRVHQPFEMFVLQFFWKSGVCKSCARSTNTGLTANGRCSSTLCTNTTPTSPLERTSRVRVGVLLCKSTLLAALLDRHPGEKGTLAGIVPNGTIYFALKDHAPPPKRPAPHYDSLVGQPHGKSSDQLHTSRDGEPWKTPIRNDGGSQLKEVG